MVRSQQTLPARIRETMPKQTRSTWPALGLLIIWLIVAGSLTWQRSRESVIPPVWDQRTYTQKADAFWNEIKQGKMQNPLNIEPTVRPPGTILLTAPLGPLKDFRNFYFRSVMLPVAITVMAVFITGITSTGLAWPSAAVGLLVGSMPMFWQFESQGGLYMWGLVDSFLASLAALAMMFMLLASIKCERYWIVPGVITMALLPLVKPTGFLVAGMIVMAWIMVNARLISLHPRGRKQAWIELVTNACFVVVSLGVVALACRNSDYFSPENIAFGNEALAQLREWGDGLQTSLNYFSHVSWQGFGMIHLLAIGGIGAINIFYGKTDQSRKERILTTWSAKIGIIMWILSLVLCYQATLFLQPRYLFPFISITMVLMAPAIINWCNKAGKVGLISFFAVPFGLLISLGSPSIARMSKNMSGYGLESGNGKEFVDLARRLTKEWKEVRGSAPTLFLGVGSFKLNYGLIAFVASYSNSLERLGYSSGEMSQSIRTAINWDKESVIAIDAIYDSDMIALGTDPENKVNKATSQASNFRNEQNTWITWLEKTPSSGSTAVAKQAPGFLVLIVKDRELLEKQMRAFMASRKWRPEFLAANKIKYYAPEQVASLQLNGEQVKKPINYENRLRVHALAISGRTPGDEKVKFTVYSERLAKGKQDNLSLFIHELDSSNMVVAMHALPLSASRYAARPIIMDETAFEVMPKTRKLAIGVYESKIGAIRTNWSRSTDWNGRRAIIELGSLPPAQHSDR